MDETGMTTMMISVMENADTADYIVQLLPALVEHNINKECVQEWFTPDAYDRACEVQYKKETNTFVSPDYKMMDYLLANKMHGTKTEIEGIPNLEGTDMPAKPRGSNQSFTSFGYTVGKPPTASTYLLTPGTNTNTLTH
jgi:hypothetical protein